jgi:hypothetical protein
MKTILLSLACVTILGGPGAGIARADDPPPVRGKVLLLDNERVLEGDIERVGDRYRVQRKIGETWVEAEKALRLCGSLEDAYAYLRDRANLHDPDERLLLAGWCRRNGLHEQALAEVRAAVALRPDHAPSRRLLEGMQRAVASAKGVETAVPAAQPEPPSLPPVELTAQALGLFTTKVQPILMNACAGCHATGRGGAFRLTRVYEAGNLARKTTRENLAAVLGELDPEQPLNSKLLLKAVGAHGGDVSKAPLPGRDSPPYRALEEWVHLTLANNPQLRDRGAGQPTAFAAMESKPSPAPPVPTETAPKTETPPPTPLPGTTPATANDGAKDPFDPDAFNREYHPKKVAKPVKSRP